MSLLKEMKKGMFASLWFVFLTFPLMVIKVDPIERIIRWRWDNALYVAIGTFLIYLLVTFLLQRKMAQAETETEVDIDRESFILRLLASPRQKYLLGGALLAVAVAFPFFSSSYQTNVMTTALMYVVLGLGLNIVVGMAGLLDLGYVAFYAVGAYSYALLNHHFDLGFWAVLPIGGGLAARGARHAKLGEWRHGDPFLMGFERCTAGLSSRRTTRVSASDTPIGRRRPGG